MSDCPGCGTAAGDANFCAICGTSISLTGGATIDALDQPTERRAEARLGNVVGSYRLLGVVGEGGMGSVFRAEHTKLGRKVALKMLHPECSKTTVAVRRFFEEARLVNQIAHENIVQITDFIEEDGGDNYYIMELLRGVDLRQLQIMEGVLPLNRALHIAVQICSALTAVHGADIVHRDLKPANVFLIHRGRERDFVKLLDFGVAKFIDTSVPGISMHKTASGVIVGTPGYMSPEQACGREVDHLTDVYALGVMLYVMVTGRPPFRAKSFGEMVVKHSTVMPVAPSLQKGLAYLIPPELDGLILDCLEKDPANRPQDMWKVETRLRELAAKFVDGGGAGAEDLPMFPPEIGGTIRYDYGPTVIESQGEGAKQTREILPEAGAELAKPRRLTWVHGAGAVAVGLSLSIVALLGVRSMRPEVPVAPVEVPPPVVAAPAEAAERTPTEAGTLGERVELSFVSVPAGAQVFLRGTNESLGLTPLKHTFGRRDEVAVFEFRKWGYRAAHREARLDAAGTVEVTLVRVESARKPSSDGKKAPAGSEAGAREGAPPQKNAPAEPPTDLRDPWAD